MASIKLTGDTSGEITISAPAVAGTNTLTLPANTGTVLTNGGSVDLNGQELILDADGDTSITADTDDQIDFKTGGTDRMSIDSSGEVSIDSGYVTLNGNEIGGIRITVADDSVGTITPPRTGGFMCITQAGNSVFPQSPDSGFIFYDVGNSLRIDELITSISGVGNELDVTTSNVTGTTGTDGRTTVAVQSGVIKIENRSSGSQPYDITFL